MKLTPQQWTTLLNHTIKEVNFLPSSFIDDENNDNSVPAIKDIELVCEHSITKVITKFIIVTETYTYMDDRYTHWKEVEDTTLKLLK